MFTYLLYQYLSGHTPSDRDEPCTGISCLKQDTDSPPRSPCSVWKHKRLALIFKFHLHHCPSLSSSPILQSPADLSGFSRGNILCYPLGGLRSATLCHNLPQRPCGISYVVCSDVGGQQLLPPAFQVSLDAPPNSSKQFELSQSRWLRYLLPWVLRGVLRQRYEVQLFVWRPSLAQWIQSFSSSSRCGGEHIFSQGYSRIHDSASLPTLYQHQHSSPSAVCF